MIPGWAVNGDDDAVADHQCRPSWSLGEPRRGRSNRDDRGDAADVSFIPLLHRAGGTYRAARAFA